MDDSFNLTEYFETTEMFTSDFQEISTENSAAPRPKGKGSLKGKRLTDFESLELKYFLALSSVILITIVVIGAIIPWISKKSRVKMHKQWNNNKVFRFFAVSFLVALIAFYINSITMTYFVVNVDYLLPEERPWIWCWSKIPYLTGRVVMESFFILRLHFVFGGSGGHINRYIIITLITLSFIAYIIGIVAVLGSKNIYDFWQQPPNPGKPGISASMSFVSTNIALTVLVITIVFYIRTLYLITVEAGGGVSPKSDGVISKSSKSSRSSKSQTSEPDIQPTTPPAADTLRRQTIASAYLGVKLRRGQLELVDNMTKNTLLGFIGLISTMMLNVKTIYEWIINDKGDPSLWRCISAFDGAINIWCMYLIFSCAATQYHYLCHGCHKGTRLICLWSTKRAIAKSATVDQLQAYIV